ncbi:MAG: tetratricopeptide repeat protein [Symploca sp. SIO3C6]|nr:tetratricopeptide repeat protein [Symploca sp. SIO3C6]
MIIRSILIVFFALLVFCSTEPVWAQVKMPELTKVQIEKVNQLRQKAFTATEMGDFPTAEGYWTQLIELLPNNPVGWGNRGNVRVSQNKLEAAIIDYNKSIELAPEAIDPYINRGVAYEGLQRWQEAIADYQRVLELEPNEAIAYNNLGNAQAGLGLWQEAIANYQKAAELEPNFAFARANYALALYQVGQKSEAIRTLRNLIRKYPQFPDVRAAITAVLWAEGKKGEAESNWVAAVGLDRRYEDLEWLQNIRRWPPLMVKALENFLTLQ